MYWRVGKTYLIRTYFKDRFFLHYTGMAEVSMTTQLQNFYESLQSQVGYTKTEPTSWLEAFNALKTTINKSRKKRKIIFIDEMPWMDTPKSEFLPALENFWNGWASSRSDVLLIVCGSATSWIVKNIFNNTGGLHNRVTAKMKILPFTLKETKEFLDYKGIAWDNYAIIKAYMAMGGIPYYLEMITKGKSVDQCIDELFYAENGELIGKTR